VLPLFGDRTLQNTKDQEQIERILAPAHFARCRKGRECYLSKEQDRAGFPLVPSPSMTDKLFTWRLIAFAIAFATGVLGLHADDEVRPITVPVRVHLVESVHDSRLNTTLTEADVQRVFGKVNKVWSQAGIVFEIESICVTHALDIEPPDEDGREFWVVAMLPKDRLLKNGLNVFYVKEIGPNGIWTNGLIVVKDTARLREVVGGIDEPLPRVTSHELGHALGLPHRQDVTNLMASGTTGFTLNEEEIQTARATALAKFGQKPKEDAGGK
jgi:hypothetical protein